MRTKELLSKQTATDIFTAVYVLVDDYLQVAQQLGRFKLPRKHNQKASYAELLTIVLVGEVLQQKNQGLWYLLVKTDYRALFPVLPELSRFYRISRNFERIYADLALLIAEHDGVYLTFGASSQGELGDAELKGVSLRVKLMEQLGQEIEHSSDKSEMRSKVATGTVVKPFQATNGCHH